MVRGVWELHRLALLAKDDDSPEADAIRDATDEPWRAPTETDRQRVRELSEDLSSLLDPAAEMRPMTAEVRSIVGAVNAARRRGDGEEALKLARQCKCYLAPAQLSYLRGTIWHEAGDAETAALFFEHAGQPAPEDHEKRSSFTRSRQ